MKPETADAPQLSSRYGKKQAGLALLATVLVPLANFLVHWAIFLFMREVSLHPIVKTILAVIWGSVGIFTIYMSLNWVASFYSDKWKRRLQPFVFIAPAVFLLGWLLFLPTLRTFYLSLLDNSGEQFVWLANYIAIFTERTLLLSLRNTMLWVVFGTLACVSFGLLVAILAERSSFEKTAKAIVFMPMAISFVGAGVIWKFIYAYRPDGEEQIGLLNAIVTFFGGEPQAWTSLLQPWNNLFLVAILVWMQTGFAMVIFSAALKGIPDSLLEAARMDGAGEVRIFFSIMIPYIKGTVVAVTTTIIVFSLKIFDIVRVMTGGQYGTEVIATQFYNQFFMYKNPGYGAALAIFLLIMVIPIILVNTVKFKKEEGF